MSTVVPPLIPDMTPGKLRASLPGARMPLPLPEPPPPAPVRCGLDYAIARLDPSGRLCIRSLLDRLGWPAAVRLSATVLTTSVMLRPDAGGIFTLSQNRMLVLPVALRRPCQLTAGDQVLLVADCATGVLVVHPLAALDELVLTYHASLTGGQPC